jgi:hypothetical protein
MRSMVEGPAGSESPSTALRAVPLPIRFADGEDQGASSLIPVDRDPRPFLAWEKAVSTLAGMSHAPLSPAGRG